MAGKRHSNGHCEAKKYGKRINPRSRSKPETICDQAKTFKHLLPMGSGHQVRHYPIGPWGICRRKLFFERRPASPTFQSASRLTISATSPALIDDGA